MASLEVGKVQIYTGDGKGKTTAAVGLALRATGYGLDVLMLQFAKKLHCAEHDAAPRLGLRIVQADRDTPEACAAQILELAREQISQVDVLILDELGEAMRRGFVTRGDVEALIAIKPATTELVLTGRGLLPLADLADLVGVRRETIVNLERGKYNPSLKLAMDIARVFPVSYTHLRAHET